MDNDDILVSRRAAREQKIVLDRAMHALHVRAADALIAGDQSVRNRALEQISKWEAGSLCNPRFVFVWRNILDMPPVEMRAAMLRVDDEGIALRQNTPFGFMVKDTTTSRAPVLVFIDTEFTNHVHPEMISVGLAAVDDRHFYAELTDYPRGRCSEFVVNEVLPLLGRVPGAACTSLELACRLHDWFNALPEPAIIMYDYETDWQLLRAAFSGELPINIGGHQLVDHKIFRHSAYKLGEVLTYSAAWPPHHALTDAQALREGYLSWQAALCKNDRKGI